MKEMKKVIEMILFVDFAKNKYLLIRLQIIVTQQVKTEVQLIRNVILMPPRNKVFFFNFYFIISVTKFAIYFLKGWSIKKA